MICILLLCLNFIGIRESANFNIVLTIMSILSEIALLAVGFALVWDYPTFMHNITQLGATGNEIPILPLLGFVVCFSVWVLSEAYTILVRSSGRCGLSSAS